MRASLTIPCFALTLGLLACGPDTAAPDAAAPAAEPADHAADPGGLEGTAWQLVKIMSMDDRTFTPEKREAYTLAFEAGGALAVRADCNRGRGTWVREGSSLTLGPLALTRMACPPGSLESRFASDLDHVRSFVERDGHIFLATMADGAILEFEPSGARAAPAFDCANADGAVETLICGDADLAALDVRLDELYRRASAAVEGSDLAELRTYQRGWIKGRNDCWKADDLRACVRENYDVRITELQIRSGALQVPAQTD